MWCLAAGELYLLSDDKALGAMSPNGQTTTDVQLRCVVVRPPASSRILRGLGAPRAPPTRTP